LRGARLRIQRNNRYFRRSPTPTRAGELDYEYFTREQAEVLVDTLTHIVCGQVGLDVEGESIGCMSNELLGEVPVVPVGLTLAGLAVLEGLAAGLVDLALGDLQPKRPQLRLQTPCDFGMVAATIPKEGAMSRLSRVLVVVVVALGVAAPSAAAVPGKQLGNTLGAMWKKVLETPTPQNPFGGGGPLCVDLGGVVAPFGASDSITCTVKPGTKVFVAAWSAECSTLEGPPFFGSNEAELRACARAVNAGVTTTDVVLDGTRVPVTEVTSGLVRLDLPADNIFGVPAGTGPPELPYLSVADGWVALLGPLTPGTHTITLDISGEFRGTAPPSVLDIHNTTTIIVQPGL
jgi:hypothetical protein